MSRRALLLATSRFADPGLAPLASPQRDAVELHALLGSSQIGGFESALLVDRTAAEMRTAIERFFTVDVGRDDLLLIFYSGHGLKDDNGALYFAATDTDLGLVRSSAVPAAFLNELMATSRARSQVVVLDCCFSGAFAHGLFPKGQTSADVESALRPVDAGVGRIVITASNAVQYSFERSDSATEHQRSLYSAGLIDGLATGAADMNGDGVIDAEEWHRFARERVRDLAPGQQPRMWAFDVAATPAIGRAMRSAAGDRPAEWPAGTGALPAPTLPRSALPPPAVTQVEFTGPPASRTTSGRRRAMAAATLGLVVAALVLITVVRSGQGDPDDQVAPDAETTAVVDELSAGDRSPPQTSVAPTLPTGGSTQTSAAPTSAATTEPPSDTTVAATTAATQPPAPLTTTPTEAVAALDVGRTVRTFEDHLGPATGVHVVAGDEPAEMFVWEGAGYRVAALVSRATGRVDAYAVMATDETFRPHVPLMLTESGDPIVVGQSVFADVPGTRSIDAWIGVSATWYHRERFESDWALGYKTFVLFVDDTTYSDAGAEPFDALRSYSNTCSDSSATDCASWLGVLQTSFTIGGYLIADNADPDTLLNELVDLSQMG